MRLCQLLFGPQLQGLGDPESTIAQLGPTWLQTLLLDLKDQESLMLVDYVPTWLISPNQGDNGGMGVGLVVGHCLVDRIALQAC